MKNLIKLGAGVFILSATAAIILAIVIPQDSMELSSKNSAKSVSYTENNTDPTQNSISPTLAKERTDSSRVDKTLPADNVSTTSAQVKTNSTSSVDTRDASTASVPSEIIGMWVFDEILGLTTGNTVLPVIPERIPQGLQVLKITENGFCNPSRYEIRGDEMGIVCSKYLPASFVGSSMKLHEDYIWVELINGFKANGPFSQGKAWPKPNAYKRTGDILELIVRSDDNKDNLWIYRYHKHYVVHTSGPLVFRADRDTVNPGEDIVLSGIAPVGAVVRVYSNSPSYFTENCTAKGYCSSPPIVSKGTRYPYPPGTDKNVLSLDEQYFDCPWPEWQASMPGGVLATAHLCITPDETGSFEVKLFNPGWNSSSSADRFEVTYNAKLANDPITKSVKATLLTCKAVPGMSCGYGNLLQRK